MYYILSVYKGTMCYKPIWFYIHVYDYSNFRQAKSKIKKLRKHAQIVGSPKAYKTEMLNNVGFKKYDHFSCNCENSAKVNNHISRNVCIIIGKLTSKWKLLLVTPRCAYTN